MHDAGPVRDSFGKNVQGASRGCEASAFAFFIEAPPSNQIRKETGRG
jgi:hypothetical protein